MNGRGGGLVSERGKNGHWRNSKFGTRTPVLTSFEKTNVDVATVRSAEIEEDIYALKGENLDLKRRLNGQDDKTKK